MYRTAVVKRDQALARLAACEERIRDLESTIEAQLKPLDQDAQAGPIADKLRAVLARKPKGSDDGEK